MLNNTKEKTINCLQIAKYFIIKAYQDGREFEITNMKIQKLLYYAQSIYLALYDEPLFADNIEAWRYGPVCPSAYHYYSKFESEQLPIPEEKELIEISPEIKEILEEVWCYFGDYHAYKLSDMSHVEFPWRKARAGLANNASSHNKIDLEELKILGEEKLLEIERENPYYHEIMSSILKQVFSEKNSNQLIKTEEIDDWLTSLSA